MAQSLSLLFFFYQNSSLYLLLYVSLSFFQSYSPILSILLHLSLTTSFLCSHSYYISISYSFILTISPSLILMFLLYHSLTFSNCYYIFLSYAITFTKSFNFVHSLSLSFYIFLILSYILVYKSIFCKIQLLIFFTIDSLIYCRVRVDPNYPLSFSLSPSLIHSLAHSISLSVSLSSMSLQDLHDHSSSQHPVLHCFHNIRYDKSLYFWDLPPPSICKNLSSMFLFVFLCFSNFQCVLTVLNTPCLLSS